MNKFIFSLCCIAGVAVLVAFYPKENIGNSIETNAIQWQSLEEAEKAAKKSNKLIFIDVYTDWCGPCKMLDRNTFNDPEVIKYVNENYHPVKFNAEGPDDVVFCGTKYSNPGYTPNRPGRNSTHQFTSHLKVRGYPTMYLLDANGVVVRNIVGYRSPEELLGELKGQAK